MDTKQAATSHLDTRITTPHADRERFAQAMRHLVTVPKKDVDDAMAKSAMERKATKVKSNE